MLLKSNQISKYHILSERPFLSPTTEERPSELNVVTLQFELWGDKEKLLHKFQSLYLLTMCSSMLHENNTFFSVAFMNFLLFTERVTSFGKIFSSFLWSFFPLVIMKVLIEDINMAVVWEIAEALWVPVC